jgi:retinol dehydrogenase-14
LTQAAASMAGRTCLVTGATSGIGKATATALARLGADLVLVARDPARGQATAAELQAVTGNPGVEVLLADLSSQASIRRAAEELTRTHDRLHVLVNNAGGSWATRHVTADGLELTFALNHLAYFLLTSLLLDLLRAGAPARVVNVTSSAQALGDTHFDDLQFERRYRGQAAYNQSKLANVLFTYELARRLEGSGVTVNCLAPGVTRTNFGREDSGPVMRLLSPLARPIMRSPEEGATAVWLASSPEAEGMTGRYYLRRRARPTPRRSSRRSYDPELARRLWRVSEELTGLRARRCRPPGRRPRPGSTSDRAAASAARRRRRRRPPASWRPPGSSPPQPSAAAPLPRRLAGRSGPPQVRWAPCRRAEPALAGVVEAAGPERWKEREPQGSRSSGRRPSRSSCTPSRGSNGGPTRGRPALVAGDGGAHAEATPRGVEQMNVLVAYASRFVRRNRAALASRPVWLFSSGPIGAMAARHEPAEPKGIAQLRRAVDPRDHRVFFGAWDRGNLERGRLGFAERIIAKRFLPEGDWRDWPEIEAWAAGIARSLAASRTVPR